MSKQGPTLEEIRAAVRRMEQDVAEELARYPKAQPHHCHTCRCFERRAGRTTGDSEARATTSAE